MTELWKDFTFESSHILPLMPDGHQCRVVHGHSYLLRVVVAGEPGELGIIRMLEDIEDAVQPCLRLLDHHHLNDVPGLENPTSEVIVNWLAKRLRVTLPDLARLELQEARSCGAIWRLA